MRDFCYVCYKAASFCICHDIVPVENRTKIVIVQHKCERFHHIGTVRIAALGLVNTEIDVVWADRDGKFTFRLDEMEAPGLLYPGPGATDLADVPAEQRPRELVLLDGTWKDVHKLYTHNPWLKALPQYSLNPTVPSRYRIRKEPNDRSISTIEAIVQSLSILEPDTPGLESLINVFEAMIDRQIEHIQAVPQRMGGPRCKRRRTRPRRTIPEALHGTLDNLVAVSGESVPAPDDKRSLVRWTALRVRDGVIFDQFIIPGEGSVVTEDHLRHMGLPREDMDQAVTPEQFRKRWDRFIAPGEVLVTWNKAVLAWLEETAGRQGTRFFLKEAWCNSRGGKCGHLQDVVRKNGLTLPAVEVRGRAAKRLAEIMAVTFSLNRQAETLR